MVPSFCIRLDADYVHTSFIRHAPQSSRDSVAQFEHLRGIAHQPGAEILVQLCFFNVIHDQVHSFNRIVAENTIRVYAVEPKAMTIEPTGDLVRCNHQLAVGINLFVRLDFLQPVFFIAGQEPYLVRLT
ncbi:unnamed protein product [Periconia digitata]|uniref:Uncharacterized protein n=1 Tax=Periconia digitata TaxID=1303443 RepID=A0A9W4UFS4_9PLEO|nr:unnamed protein product [Periconia digitata]